LLHGLHRLQDISFLQGKIDPFVSQKRSLGGSGSSIDLVVAPSDQIRQGIPDEDKDLVLPGFRDQAMEPDPRGDKGILMVDVLFHLLNTTPKAFQKGLGYLPGGEVNHSHLKNLSDLPEFDKTISLHLKPRTDGEINGLDIRKKIDPLNVDAITNFNLNESQDIKDAEGLPQGRPTDVKLLSQGPLGGQAVSRLILLP
jgi:hypothetical protein